MPTVTSEGESIYKHLVQVSDNIFRELNAVPAEALNWPLGVPETNTLYASVFHAAGATEYWLVVYIDGGSVARDREQEFRAAGGLASLQLKCQQCLDSARDVIAGLSPVAYDELRDVILSGAAQRWTVRECLLHVIEHTNVHLG